MVIFTCYSEGLAKWANKEYVLMTDQVFKILRQIATFANFNCCRIVDVHINTIVSTELNLVVLSHTHTERQRQR